jgi:hypothetical protein
MVSSNKTSIVPHLDSSVNSSGSSDSPYSIKVSMLSTEDDFIIPKVGLCISST